jgi:hypothetical protein
MEQKYQIKSTEYVAVIELYDRAFSIFCEAIQEVSKRYDKEKKILMMQSVEKDNQPFKIVIVFEF